MSTEVSLDLAERDLPCLKDDPVRRESTWNGRTVSLLLNRGFVFCTSWLAKSFERIGRGLLETDEVEVLPTASLSSQFETEGSGDPGFRIVGINGVSTMPGEALSHANYLKAFTQDMRVGWVYNRSHTLIADVSEVFFMNFLGYSPNTANLLLESWRSFHEENREMPQVKLLQFCHSQGAVHVKNALMLAKEEIRDRVIVVAIAPAVVVPGCICYQSFNYRSKGDVIPYAELSFLSAFDTNEYRMAKPLEMALAFREELITLDSEIAFDHDFQSTTFKSVIAYHIEKYMTLNGNENYQQNLALK